MSLLPKRNIRRWLHARQVIYIIGLVDAKPGDTPEAVAAAEARALDTLRHRAAGWGLVKVKRGSEPGAKTAYTEESVLNYMRSRESAAA
jgi:hypothetical protein